MSNEFTNAQRAKVLTEALPYIKKYNNKVIVIKYGGNAMINEDLKNQVMEDICLLSLVGVKVVLVHGGGPEITDMLNRVSKTSHFIDGLRVTDGETIEIVQMVLAGKINKNLVNILQKKGGNAVGISGIDAGMIKAKIKRPELGYVGTITDVNVQPIKDLLSHGYIPIVSTVAGDDDGNVYNINADTAAACIAGALSAESMILMTDIAGILMDKDDRNTIVSCVDVAGAKKLFEDGVISGGMIPKVECCINAIDKGVKKVIIMDGTTPHSLLMETLTDEGSGTMVVRDLNE